MSETTPTFTELLDWAEGRVAEPRRTQLAALVAQDTESAASVRWIEQFLAASRTMPLATPPAATSERLRETLEEYLGPWRPEQYSVGALALAVGGPGTASGTRSIAGASVEATYDDLVFETEVGRVRVTLRPGVDAGVDARITFDETAADAFPVGESRVLLAAGDRVRRSAVRVSATELEASSLPADLDRIWLVHDDRTVRLSPPDGWPSA